MNRRDSGPTLAHRNPPISFEQFDVMGTGSLVKESTAENIGFRTAIPVASHNRPPGAKHGADQHDTIENIGRQFLS